MVTGALQWMGESRCYRPRAGCQRFQKTDANRDFQSTGACRGCPPKDVSPDFPSRVWPRLNPSPWLPSCWRWSRFAASGFDLVSTAAGRTRPGWYYSSDRRPGQYYDPYSGLCSYCCRCQCPHFRDPSCSGCPRPRPRTFPRRNRPRRKRRAPGKRSTDTTDNKLPGDRRAHR